MMKFRTVMAFLLVPTLWPSSTFAVQGENITFSRLPGGGVSLFGQVGTDVEDGTQQVELDADGDNDSQFSETSANISLRADAAVPTIGRSDADLLLSGELTTSIGTTNFVPNHSVSAGNSGSCFGFQPRALAASAVDAFGEITASYATAQGNAAAPTATNQFATMDVFMHFLLAGGPKETLDRLKGSMDIPILGIVRPRAVGGFCQEITVGDSAITVTRLGADVIVTSGVLARSTEKSTQNLTEGIVINSAGCGVNNFLTARQRVLIDSGGAPEVNVCLTSTVGAGCFLILEDDGSVAPGDTSGPYIWSSVCSAFFFARDYCLTDGGGGPGGGTPVGCQPLNVLIDDGKGGIGPADINDVTVPAFNGLETVTVVVAAESDFQCDLVVSDAKTGGLAASLDASEATYDAETGIAVFDLTSVDPPIEPGLYEVLIGTMFRAEVYVALPGDANLDGTVNILGDAIILVSNLGNSMGVTWFDGDFNCDGVVNTLGDAFLLVANLNQSVCP